MARLVREPRKHVMHKTSKTPRTLIADQCCLRSVMPTTGSKLTLSTLSDLIRLNSNTVLVKYQSEKRLMHNIHREKRVADALQAVGYKMVRRSISHAFADMFRVASPIVSTAHAECVDLWDILPRVQREINWARQLPEAIFFELFTSLIEARCEWQKNLAPSSQSRDNDRFIHQLDAFRRNVGDCPKEANNRGGEHVSWILVDAVFFNELASGLDIDEDEEEDVTMLDVVNTDGAGADKYIPDMDKVVARLSPALLRMNIGPKKRTKLRQ
ncbi:hypothetical protein F5Y12DRAFT_415168 [Xylaria sp. FL1777]|nr:hypothetical protein F5Y12DRAFT_415168 [Xylaria sp. FL1777]